MCLITKLEPVVVMIPNNGDRRRAKKQYTQSLRYPHYETLFATHLGMLGFESQKVNDLRAS